MLKECYLVQFVNEKCSSLPTKKYSGCTIFVVKFDMYYKQKNEDDQPWVVEIKEGDKVEAK